MIVQSYCNCLRYNHLSLCCVLCTAFLHRSDWRAVTPNTHRRRRRDKTVSSRRRRRCVLDIMFFSQSFLVLRVVINKTRMVRQINTSSCGYNIIDNMIIRPLVYGSNGRSYKMLVMFFFFFLYSFATRSPRSLGRSP